MKQTVENLTCLAELLSLLLTMISRGKRVTWLLTVTLIAVVLGAALIALSLLQRMPLADVDVDQTDN